MIILTGEFLSYDQTPNKTTGELRNYINLLEVESSVVRKVSVDRLEPYLKMARGEVLQIPIKVNCFNNQIYFKELK